MWKFDALLSGLGYSGGMFLAYMWYLLYTLWAARMPLPDGLVNT